MDPSQNPPTNPTPPTDSQPPFVPTSPSSLAAVQAITALAIPQTAVPSTTSTGTVSQAETRGSFPSDSVIITDPTGTVVGAQIATSAQQTAAQAEDTTEEDDDEPEVIGVKEAQDPGAFARKHRLKGLRGNPRHRKKTVQLPSFSESTESEDNMEDNMEDFVDKILDISTDYGGPGAYKMAREKLKELAKLTIFGRKDHGSSITTTLPPSVPTVSLPQVTVQMPQPSAAETSPIVSVTTTATTVATIVEEVVPPPTRPLTRSAGKRAIAQTGEVPPTRPMKKLARKSARMSASIEHLDSPLTLQSLEAMIQGAVNKQLGAAAASPVTPPPPVVTAAPRGKTSVPTKKPASVSHNPKPKTTPRKSTGRKPSGTPETLFRSPEAEEQYAARFATAKISKHSVIDFTDKVFKTDKYSPVPHLFAFQRWIFLLNFNIEYTERLVRMFYANLEVDNDVITSLILGTPITITAKSIADLFHLPLSGICPGFDNEFVSPNLYAESLYVSPSVTTAQMKHTKYLKPHLYLALHILWNTVAFQGGRFTEINEPHKEMLHYLETNQPINLPEFIFNTMAAIPAQCLSRAKKSLPYPQIVMACYRAALGKDLTLGPDTLMLPTLKLLGQRKSAGPTDSDDDETEMDTPPSVDLSNIERELHSVVESQKKLRSDFNKSLAAIHIKLDQILDVVAKPDD